MEKQEGHNRRTVGHAWLTAVCPRAAAKIVNIKPKPGKKEKEKRKKGKGKKKPGFYSWNVIDVDVLRRNVQMRGREMRSRARREGSREASFVSVNTPKSGYARKVERKRSETVHVYTGMFVCVRAYACVCICERGGGGWGPL